MGGLNADQTGPDFGAIEAGSFMSISDAIWMLQALINQLGQTTMQQLSTKADDIRQDRVALMAIYAP